MKKFIFVFIIFAFCCLFFPVSSLVFAHPGNTDSSGCHTCRTNCDSWGLSYGEYHCHNPKTTQPKQSPSNIQNTGGSCFGFLSFILSSIGLVVIKL